MAMDKNGKKKRKLFDIVFVLVAAGVLLISVGKLVYTYWEYRSEDNANKKIEAAYVTYETEEQTEGQGAENKYVEYPAIKVDMAALKAANPDTVGWIYWDLFDVSYPVVQGADNDAYIRTSFSGEYAKSGTLFLDSGCARDFSDWHSVIYGHDMKDKSMFGRFKEMHTDVDVNADPYFYFYTENKVYKYKVFAYAIVSPYDELYCAINSEQEYDSFVDRALAISTFSALEEPDLSDRPRIMSLSTCYQHTKRTLVEGYLEKVYEPVW